MAEVGGMSNLPQGINGPPFQLSYMLLPSAPHLVAVWPFGKKGKKTSCLGISKNCLSLPTLVTSAIPPEPLFSLLTNIPQVTFPICLKSDSLTGASVGDLGNSQGVVTFTIETDGKNQDLEISLLLLLLLSRFSHVRLFETPWTVAHQAPPPMGFPRQEYRSGLPLPSPRNFTRVLQFSPKSGS